MRRLPVAVVLLSLLAGALPSVGAATRTRGLVSLIDPAAAHAELYEGARLYRAGQYAEAEAHFRRALELDPSGKNTRLFIARAIHQQYKPGDTSPENVAQAERAIEAYAVLLADERHGDDAFKATVFLYSKLNRDDKVEEMLRRRGEDTSVESGKRADAFVILASRRWYCSYEITERKENKRALNRPGKVLVRYRKPTNPADFDRARGCADEGLRLSGRALALAPDSVNGWSYRAALLRELAKLAEMERNAARKNKYERLYRKALDEQKRLERDEQRRRELKRQSDSTASAAPRR